MSGFEVSGGGVDGLDDSGDGSWPGWGTILCVWFSGRR